MLGELVTKDVIKVNEKCDNWKDAIGVVEEILESKGIVEDRYKDAIINNFKELGPYMVIAPGIVLSHARPEGGVNDTGISILTLDKPLNFGNEQNDPVKLVVTLAAKDNENHLELLSSLMEMFMNTEDLNGILEANNQNEVYKIIQKYN